MSGRPSQFTKRYQFRNIQFIQNSLSRFPADNHQRVVTIAPEDGNRF
jgi:hypothetical protein